MNRKVKGGGGEGFVKVGKWVVGWDGKIDQRDCWHPMDCRHLGGCRHAVLAANRVLERTDIEQVGDQMLRRQISAQLSLWSLEITISFWSILEQPRLTKLTNSLKDLCGLCRTPKNYIKFVLYDYILRIITLNNICTYKITYNTWKVIYTESSFFAKGSE